MASLLKNSTSGKLKVFNEMKILKKSKEEKKITSVKIKGYTVWLIAGIVLS